MDLSAVVIKECVGLQL